ncbi:hypothetical protein SAMN05444339_11049 [Loktanella atrilutea]|uniref:Uncharacterized protein n=1 Tax=Loktanella atrilutea TaxID=366533 RepID=A0A1M5DLM8_LOKAT|nr:putative Ig domain-containing protein [Loktanella atrilutea]SHF67860.1 hypothetical protein SAMN05444339_11049 [Loktanella atrilutea]
MPRITTFTITPDVVTPYTIILNRDERAQITVTGGEANLVLKISKTPAGEPIVILPGRGGVFDLFPQLLEGLVEGQPYAHNIWDETVKTDPILIASGTITCRPTIASAPVTYPTVINPNGKKTYFVTQAELDTIDADGPRETDVTYTVVQGLTGPVVAPLSITGNPSGGTVGAAYSFTPSVTGGRSPYTFALTAGTLPGGTTFNATTGAITGTPTTAQTRTGISIRVTDASGATATLSGLSITVAAAQVAPTATGGLADQSYTQGSGDKTVTVAGDFSNATGGTWSVVGAGASISAAGLVTIPTGSLRQAVTVTVTYTNAAGSASSAFSVTVAAAVPVTAIGASGWKATYPAPPTFAPDTAPQTLTVARAGFDAQAAPATITDALTLTKRIRKPYPDQATLTADQVALSDYIYATDAVPGVANNSLAVSPKPIANWILPDRRVVGNTLLLRVSAWHRDMRNREQVAAVKFIATDGTRTVSQVVSVSTLVGLGSYAHPVTAYECNLDISTLDDNAAITVNAEVYPHFGAAASVLSTAGTTAYREFRPQTYLKNVALAANPIYVYVAATGGDNATAAVSTNAATAKAAPCATVGGAISRAYEVNGRLDGVEIRLGEGTHTLSSGSSNAGRVQEIGELVITRDPAVARANVIVKYGSFIPYLGAAGSWWKFRDICVGKTNNAGFRGTAASPAYVVYEKVTTVDLGFKNEIISTADTYASLIEVDGIKPPVFVGVYPNLAMTIGCTAEITGAVDPWCLMGCAFSPITGVLTHVGNASSPGAIIAFNSFKVNSNDINGLYEARSRQVFACNVCENTNKSLGANLRVSADAATYDTSHVILVHNTFTGYGSAHRWNVFYDDTNGLNRTHELMAVKGNISSQINTKSDLFKSDGTRQGNWPYMFGVGCDGEFSQFIDAQGFGLGSSFAQNYPGLTASIGTSDTVRNDPLFVDYRGATAADGGTGGGNYALQSTSPAKNRVKPVLRFDLAGNTRSAVKASAGAYE